MMARTSRRRAQVISAERDDYVRAAATTIDAKNRRYLVNCLDEFLRYVPKNTGSSDLRNVTKNTIDAYAQMLLAKGNGVSTVRQKLRRLQKWLNWLADAGRIPDSPTKEMDVTELIADAQRRRHLS